MSFPFPHIKQLICSVNLHCSNRNLPGLLEQAACTGTYLQVGAFQLKVCWIPTKQKDEPQENLTGAVLVFANWINALTHQGKKSP